MLPFDARRSGFVLGEGAAVLVLESLEHALARNANIIAEFTGYGFSFAPSSKLRLDAAIAAMDSALSAANLSRSDIGAVFANANGSIAGDRIEGQAIQSVLPACPVTSIKPVLGQQVLPGTAGFAEPDRKLSGLGVVQDTREANLSSVMVNAFGRSGNHASVVFSSYVN
jgi:3-oxoacyl-[acyl-carrier-protein] synthase II